tara:strand:- start:79 stop:324 length:246 start_codon:yes stop_codon:yes gene_type:complete
MSSSLTRKFLNILRSGKTLQLPSIYSNTYNHRDVELAATRAFNIYNKEPKIITKKYTYKTMPSNYSNLYNYREDPNLFLKR